MNCIERPLAWLLTSAIAALSFACSDDPIAWKEEVKLRSGEIIVVNRTAKLDANFVAGGGGGSINRGMTVEVAQPLKPDNPGVWDARYVPIVFDRDPQTSEWTVIATFFHCDSWYDLGRPALPYTEYRFREGKWIQQALTPHWIGTQANMVPADGSNGEREGTISSTKKEYILANPAISNKFKAVVSSWKTTC